MTRREQHRAHILTRTLAGTLPARVAAQVLGLSLRHARRLLAGLRANGFPALAHGNRGRPSPRRLDAALRARVLTLARTRYAGVNDHQLAELLAEREGVHISRRSLQRLLRAAGLGTPRPRRPPRHRRRRLRMPQLGLLIQLDGSHHAWLEDRGPRLVLLAAIDDATGRILAALFREAEDALGYLLLLRQLLRRYGIPGAWYTDRHSIFEVWDRGSLSIPEQLRGQRDLSQIGRALQDLGIGWIGAHSPQAKGRVERLFGTLQDRLVVELRLHNACTLADAQRVLVAFRPRYNARFARPPADPTPAWRPLPSPQTIDEVCCFKYERAVANDNTLQLGDRVVHLTPGPGGRSYAGTRVEVHRSLSGVLTVHYQGQRLAVHHTEAQGRRGLPSHYVAPRPAKLLPDVAASPRDATPGPDHPWRRYEEVARRKRLQAQGVTFS